MHCNIMHLKMADRLEIEERVDLINELKGILTNRYNDCLPPQYQSILVRQCKNFPSSVIKDILFEYYLTIIDIKAYKKVNKWFKKYAMKLKQLILEEGYVLRERLLRRELDYEKDDLRG